VERSIVIAAVRLGRTPIDATHRPRCATTIDHGVPELATNFLGHIGDYVL
jgi:hypothetical protein